MTEAEDLSEFTDTWKCITDNGYASLEAAQIVRNMPMPSDKNFVRKAGISENVATLYFDRPLVRDMYADLGAFGIWWNDKRWHITVTTQSARPLWMFLRKKKFEVGNELAITLRKLTRQKELPLLTNK